MDFKSPLVWPDALPGPDDYVGRRALYQLTHGRIISGLDMDWVERRARRLLYYYGSPPGQLQGSQYKNSQSPYYTELFAHELSHALHAPCTLKEIRDGRLEDMIDLYVINHTREENNNNELETSASTTLVLEYLGLPYDLYHLAVSTARNLRGHLYLANEAYDMLRPMREQQNVKDIARQIAQMLVKMKNGSRTPP